MKKTVPYLNCLHFLLVLTLSLGAFFFIPPLSENMSALGNAYEQPLYLFLWAAASASFFFLHTASLFQKYAYPYPYMRIFLAGCTLCMLLSVLLPFQPDSFPILSKWHVRIAMAGCIGYLLLTVHLLCHLCIYSAALPISILHFFLFFIFSELLLYIVNGGVSMLMETSFSIIMSAFLLYLKQA